MILFLHSLHFGHEGTFIDEKSLYNGNLFDRIDYKFTAVMLKSIKFLFKFYFFPLNMFSEEHVDISFVATFDDDVTTIRLNPSYTYLFMRL